MKTISSIALIFLVACGSSNTAYTGSGLPVIKRYSYGGIYYYKALNQADTVVCVVAPGVKAKKSARFINAEGLKQVQYVIKDNDTLYFTHSVWDANHAFKVTYGSGAPGQISTDLYTYNSFPYLITNQEAIH